MDLTGAGLRDLILCVDESLGCGTDREEFGRAVAALGQVVWFNRRLKAKDLLDVLRAPL